MIVEMKHLTLLCVAKDGVKALESLREIGCVHVDLSSADSPDFSSAKDELADAERAERILEKAVRTAAAGTVSAGDGNPETQILSNAKSATLVAAV